MSDLPGPPPTPPPGASQQPPAYQPPPPAYQPPPPPPAGSPGYIAPPIGPTSGRQMNLGAQITGAGWSIGVGAVAIVVPIITSLLFTNDIVYFRLLPILGAIYGVRSIMRGFVIGGIIGIVLNVVAGVVSLAAMGVI